VRVCVCVSLLVRVVRVRGGMCVCHRANVCVCLCRCVCVYVVWGGRDTCDRERVCVSESMCVCVRGCVNERVWCMREIVPNRISITCQCFPPPTSHLTLRSRAQRLDFPPSENIPSYTSCTNFITTLHKPRVAAERSDASPAQRLDFPPSEARRKSSSHHLHHSHHSHHSHH